MKLIPWSVCPVRVFAQFISPSYPLALNPPFPGPVRSIDQSTRPGHRRLEATLQSAVVNVEYAGRCRYRTG
uniref:Putative secreted protein n=1 Tax=Anopheles marajoara TaxID=58244 RepID=A0A2M4CEI7_9DIPT